MSSATARPAPSPSLLGPGSISRPTCLRSTSFNSTTSHKSSAGLSLTRSHEKDKPRLYLALFPRGGDRAASSVRFSTHATCESWHWALVIGPKSPARAQAGTVYHIVHPRSDGDDETPHFYEEMDLNSSTHLSRSILVRIALAKVLDEAQIETLLRSVSRPVRHPDTTSVLTVSSSSSSSTVSSPTFSTYGSDSEPSPFDTSTTCLGWVKKAYSILTDDQRSTSNPYGSSVKGFGKRKTKVLKSFVGPEDWPSIEACTRNYAKRKRQQGRFRGDDMASWNPDEIPTWNFWENRETTD